MRYYKDAIGTIISVPDPPPGWVRRIPPDYVEVANANGDPLPTNVGVGNTSPHKPGCGADGGYACTCGFTVAKSPLGVQQSPVTSTKSKSSTSDEENERLIRKVLPPFRGEAPCEPPKAPASTPQYPYFNNAEDRNAESFRLVKRHISVAMREWPICRHSREPLELQIEGRPIPGDPYGGEYARPTFYCATCGVYS